jgi:hypothetical protein
MKKLLCIIFFSYYREVNKTLRDENDALRAMIESNKSMVSPSDVSIKLFYTHTIISFNY